MNSMNNLDSNRKLSKNQVLRLSSILRSLGIKSGLSGTPQLKEAIMIAYKQNNEIINFEAICKEVAKNYNSKSETIQSNIKYTLHHRVERLTEKNFERIFKIEFDEDLLWSNNFILEVVHILEIYA